MSNDSIRKKFRSNLQIKSCHLGDICFLKYSKILIRRSFNDFTAKIREPSNVFCDTKIRYLYIHAIFSVVIHD